MNILITGANGFIGRNLGLALCRQDHLAVIRYDLDSKPGILEEWLSSADVIFHLAGINRSEEPGEFREGNYLFTEQLCSSLSRLGRKPILVFSSSTQALLDNPYGISKRQAEEAILKFSGETGAQAVIFRLPGVFGKWCRPNYNSVVATFCHNVSRNLPIEISDPSKELELVHIDDVLAAFLLIVRYPERIHETSFGSVNHIFKRTLGELAALVHDFREGRDKNLLPELKDSFVRRLYSTYLSYLPPDDFAVDPAAHQDNRGSLSELLRAGDYGQIFVSRTKPGVTRGNHYHDAKVEKFMVLDGQACVRFRDMATGDRVKYSVNGKKLRVIDIPPGWTHSIENTGSSEMIVLFWASEPYDPQRSDTYPAEVMNE